MHSRSSLHSRVSWGTFGAHTGKTTMGLDDEATLKRMPRGFAEEHPAAQWLRFQSFVAGRELSDKQIVSARLSALLADDFARLTPLVRWLNGALGLKPAKGR